jgi:zinc protease
MRTSTVLTILTGLLSFSGLSSASNSLVSQESIATQKKLTSVHKLKNGIPVYVRTIPDSDILSVVVSYSFGMKDLPSGRKVLNEWYWGAKSLATKTYPKAEMFSLKEKYGLSVGCAGGIEFSSCSLDAIGDYWDKGVAVLASVIKEPAFTDEDVKLTRDRLTAKLKNTPTDPGTYSNEIINEIYYPVGHPYRLNHDEALKELEGLTKDDLNKLQGAITGSNAMRIVVVTSMPADKVVKDLNASLGDIKSVKIAPVNVAAPKINDGKTYNFHDRELPTAYIRMKFNAPGAKEKDRVGAKLLFEILSEELGEEIRTRRSLSYSVGSAVLQYNAGLGIIAASTSKPKETLEAMHIVIENIKKKKYSDEEIREYKNVFATNYFLTQETHDSLSSAISNSLDYHGNTDELYELPKQLEKITSADINRMANQYLKDFRVGVIYGRKDFEDKWATDFISQHLASSNQKKK